MNLLLLLFLSLLSFCPFAGCTTTPQGGPALPLYRDSTLTPEWISADSLEGRSVHNVGLFSLTNQNGEKITQSEMQGNISIVNFFFTRCPSLCPRLTRSMARVQDSLRGVANLQIFSLSVTPDIDSVPVLKAYADANGVQSGRWHLLTGKKSDIYQLAHESFFAGVDTGAAAFLHTETFYLLDAERRIRGVYNGTLGTDMVLLISDVRTLAAQGN